MAFCFDPNLCDDIDWSDSGSDDSEFETSEDEDAQKKRQANPDADPSTIQVPPSVTESYKNADPGPSTPVCDFTPSRMPGMKDPRDSDGANETSDIDISSPGSLFSLFFTPEIKTNICEWTNHYATQLGPRIPDMYKDWKPLDREELDRYLGLLLYMSVAQTPHTPLYWREDTMLNFKAPMFMSYRRFMQLQAFQKFSPPKKEGNTGPPQKGLLAYIKEKCRQYFQPNEYVCVHEMTYPASYTRDRVNINFYLLSDSVTGYAYDFDIYRDKDIVSGSVFSHYVVKLCSHLYGQGYKVLLDDARIPVKLFKDLHEKQLYACGTVNLKKKGLPEDFVKNAQVFKKYERGSTKWVREGPLLFVQWKDWSVNTFVSTIHRHDPEEVKFCKRKIRVNHQNQQAMIRQPVAIYDFENRMQLTNKSTEDMFNKYEIIRREFNYPSNVLFQCIDIANWNSFVMFKEFAKKNPDDARFTRHRKFEWCDFASNVMDGICDVFHHYTAEYQQYENSEEDDEGSDSEREFEPED